MPINEQKLVADLSKMVSIPSANTFGKEDPTNPVEEAIAQYYEEQLKSLGFEINSADVENGRRNVWGTLKGSGKGPTVLLAGHMDTVGIEGYDEPFSGEVKDGKIYGRGSCDMKAGLAAYLEVARILVETGETLSGDLIIAGVVDEEYGMIGSKHFGTHGPKIDFAIVAEPSSLKLSIAHRGQVCLSLKTYGLSAHSSVPENGINAIYHMNSAITALRKYADDLSKRKPDPLCGMPTLSIGVITGGESVSSVPDWCEIEIDRRMIPGESFDSIHKEFSEVLNKLAEEIPDFKYELTKPSLNAPPLSTDVNSPVVKAIVESYKKVCNQEPEFMTFPGSTDAPNFGCPTVICGAGSLEQCHTINEYVPISEMKTAVSIYLETIRILLK